jgi:hypothetical protein
MHFSTKLGLARSCVVRSEVEMQLKTDCQTRKTPVTSQKAQNQTVLESNPAFGALSTPPEHWVATVTKCLSWV